MRIAQFMARAGVASRRACEEIITKETVLVNDKLIKKLHYQVEEGDKVTYNGKNLTGETPRYIIINKPVGYLCTHQDQKGRRLIYDLIPSPERLFTIGRLDYNSEGLIILTNDGDFSQTMAHPSYKIEKKYRVRVNNRIDPSQLHQIRIKGITYKGVLYTVKSINIKTASNKTTTINFTLSEGKNHEIRKICAALGLAILTLKRVQIAHIRLGQLPLGSSRNLTITEIKKLKKYY